MAGAAVPDHSIAENWRSSTTLGGNPNSDDSSPLVGNPTDDDDSDGLAKLLEHALGTSDDDGADGTATLKYRSAFPVIFPTVKRSLARLVAELR